MEIASAPIFWDITLLTKPEQPATTMPFMTSEIRSSRF